MRISVVVFLLASIFFSFSSSAQIARSTTFDDRPSCEENKGVWRQYGDGCVDECEPKLDKFSICTRAVTFGCDCGKGRCFDEGTCVSFKDYKKKYDARQAEEKKILDAAKEKRKAELIANQSTITNNLIAKAQQAPVSAQNNYADFYRDKVAEPIPVEAVTTIPTNIIPSGVTKIDPPIAAAPTIVIQNSNAEIPPLFLQQEKARKEAEQQAEKATKEKTEKEKEKSGELILPVIPLPQ